MTLRRRRVLARAALLGAGYLSEVTGRIVQPDALDPVAVSVGLQRVVHLLDRWHACERLTDAEHAELRAACERMTEAGTNLSP